ncbi:DUF1343 domain-containing protein [Dysgonomonas sp. OttesenSCG-928-M03]|nr:DUF1343 domain-containing protein [Dysgonomonas sp. OttesenSCG-928-M03]
MGAKNLRTGADQLDRLLPGLRNKSVALVVNHTSCLSDGTHLLDALLSNNVKVNKIFAPEHGFRGNADAGARIAHDKDEKTGLPLISLYGRNKKPTAEMLRDVDVVIFDIQDVGARFYTYITTMHYVMDACAQYKKEFVVLDRPNPHDYIDGPVLEKRHKSFVGMHPIPVLHGLTVGELAQMINSEGWLTEKRQCDLEVIPVEGWEHGDAYSLPIKPSPNLPNDQSIKMYASLCFFEATNVSVGRGTYFPFQVIGFPNPKYGSFTFTPKSLPGYDTNPLQKGKTCYGVDLRNEKLEGGFTLSYLIDFYKKSRLGAKFFKSPQFMNMLSGTNKLQQQIIAGKSEKEIRKSWESGLAGYKEMRQKYLLYKDKRYE